MCLEFIDDFCAACEPTAWIWHEGHDPIGRGPITIIVVDVDLQEIQRHQLASFSEHFTHFIECVVASNKVVSTSKKVRSAHVEMLKVEKLRKRDGRRGERPCRRLRNYATR